MARERTERKFRLFCLNEMPQKNFFNKVNSNIFHLEDRSVGNKGTLALDQEWVLGSILIDENLLVFSKIFVGSTVA